MYGNSYGRSSSSIFDVLFSSGGALGVVTVVCFILAIIGGFVLFFGFLAKKNEKKFTGFLGWMYDFLNFKKMLSESILRVIYLITACFITLYSLGILLFMEGGSIGGRLLAFLLMLVIGNAVARLAYEFILVILIICKNTTEINRKMGGNQNEQTPQNIYSQPQQAYIQPQQTYQAPQPQYTSDTGVLDQQNAPAIVFCTNCGNQYNAAELQCPHCGMVRQ